jgi:AAA domain-containing protein
MNLHDPQPDRDLPPVLALEQFQGEVAPLLKTPFRSQFGALFLDQLDEPGREFEWLIDGWLSCGDRSVIGGKSQSGKSFLATHAAMCIAHDREFFGAQVKPGLVVYQAGEGALAFKRRLRAWRKHHGVVFSRETPFVLLQSPVDLWRADGDTPKLIEEIKGIAAQYNMPLRLVVFDTLAMATVGADEISGRDMGLVMANVAKIGAGTGAAVSLIHHLNADGVKLRGHTSIFANIDQVWLVDEDPATKIRTATLDKIRDGGERGASFSFELMSVSWGQFDAKGKAVTSCVCLPVGQKEAIRRDEALKGYRLDDDEVMFMRAYFDAEKRFGEPVPADMDLAHDVRSVVSYTAVKREYLKLSPSDSPSDENASEEDAAKAAERHREALKKRLQRLREKLTRLNVIGCQSDRMWWTGIALRAFPQTMPRPAADDDDGFGGSDIPF